MGIGASASSKDKSKSKTDDGQTEARSKRGSKKSVAKPIGGQKFSYQEMVALVDSITNGTCTDVTIVDVRSKDEVGATGIIPNAHVLPLGEIDKALAMSPEEFETTFGFTKPTEEDHLVLYCLRGMRTEKALVVFKEHGYNKVDTFPGSWIEWSENTKK